MAKYDDATYLPLADTEQKALKDFDAASAARDGLAAQLQAAEADLVTKTANAQAAAKAMDDYVSSVLVMAKPAT